VDDDKPGNKTARSWTALSQRSFSIAAFLAGFFSHSNIIINRKRFFTQCFQLTKKGIVFSSDPDEDAESDIEPSSVEEEEEEVGGTMGSLAGMVTRALSPKVCCMGI
jgi:hypothetical protein